PRQGSSRPWTASSHRPKRSRSIRARAARSCAWPRGRRCNERSAEPLQESSGPLGGQRSGAGRKRGGPMPRRNVVLLIAVLVSALYLVRTQYESRRLFTAVDKAVG